MCVHACVCVCRVEFVVQKKKKKKKKKNMLKQYQLKVTLLRSDRKQ